MSVVKMFKPVEKIAPAEKTAIVSVNGVEIHEAVIAAEMAEYSEKDRGKARQQAATALVLRELLLQEANAEAIDGDDEAKIEALLSLNIQVPIAEAAHCERFFSENPEKFHSPDLMEARHILLAASPGDDEAREQARFEANRIIEELKADAARFEEFAQTYSACPSREQGGRLGQLSKGATVPEFEGPLFCLQQGLSSTAIETRYGLHVVWVDHKIKGEPLPYEHVKEAIAHYLEDSVFRKSVSQYIQLLAGKATITGIDIKASDSPLLQ